MTSIEIEIPNHTTLEESLKFCAELPSVEDASQFVIRRDTLRFATPFGMLLIATRIRKWRAEARRLPSPPQFKLTGKPLADYPGYMGFWQSIRNAEDVGQALTEPSHVPICRLVVEDITREARARSMPTSNLLKSRADDLAEILIQDSATSAGQTLEYAIRELMRNSVEHSASANLWYCAQYWPTKDLVELAIVDEGRGILSSLLENPKYSPKSESEAIRLSLRSGVSRVDYERNPLSENSGEGLFVISELAKRTGSLFVLSNNEGVLFESGGTCDYMSTFGGVAVRLQLKPSAFGEILFKLLVLVRQGVAPDRITPSMMARLSS